MPVAESIPPALSPACAMNAQGQIQPVPGSNPEPGTDNFVYRTMHIFGSSLGKNVLSGSRLVGGGGLTLMATQLDQWRRSWLEQSPVLVESPLSIVDSRLDGLPDGVSVDRGEIRVRFETATQALEKLLALAMAIGNDRDRFERIATGQE